ncbi:MAG: hypothetical protein PHY28_08895 [Dehalococcoidales bacterium]|nr:hypothetical protein [Dehalococcoidales bacterium]
MLEIPEAINVAGQINKTVSGKKITGVVAAHSPHKLAWFYGDPAKYASILTSREIGKANACGGMVEIKAGNANILFGDGAAAKFHDTNAPRPPKHQLLIEFEDLSAISFAVQMYGGIGSFLDGELDNTYYKMAKEKLSPLSPAFDKGYFSQMVSAPEVQKLSLKALLATEQRIPGLGNGVLQDILFNAKMHPKKKVSTLSEKDKEVLFNSLKTTLSEMVRQGGRDTEMDLFGHPGGYKTLLCKNTVNKPCPVCGTIIKKEAYMGGTIYFCENCQSA